MENLYNVMYSKPALEHWQMPARLEELALSLVESGLMRIDAHESSNFIRFSDPYNGINIVFSQRELNDEKLTPKTKHIIEYLLSRGYSGQQLKNKVESEFYRLQNDVNKVLGVSARTEMRLARIMVQSCHPSVMLLLMAEGAELFISYSHTVGDMMDIQSWQSHGSSSGLQSIGHMENAVFVSTGGNPFATDESKEYESDGDDAIARMMIIAGQELGHFADIIRDKRGRKISRYSANINATRPKKKVRTGRIADMRNVYKISEQLKQAGLREVAYQEQFLLSYKKRNVKGLIVINKRRKVNNLNRWFRRRAKKYGVSFVNNITPNKDNFWSTVIEGMIGDMLFNLEPKADAYEREDPLEEETIACVEALARVPQQVNKWGHFVTRHMIPNLYKIYYGQVLPGCIRAYENISGNKYDISIKRKPIWLKYYQKFFYKGV